MLFSVVVPVYNRASTVADTLRSVQKQDLADFECIVVDDGSRDGEMLEAVIESLEDDRFVYVRQENGGGGAARNAGILRAGGEWICLLDSDDTFARDKLSRLAIAVAANPDASMIYHPARVVRGVGLEAVRPARSIRDGESVASFTFRGREFVQTSTITVASAVAKRVLFDPDLRKAQDIDFLMRLQKDGGRFVWIDELLSTWNDVATEGRVGAPRRPESVTGWFDRTQDLFVEDEKVAFRATYLSYEIARTAPMDAFAMIARGFLSGVVPAKVSLQVLLRAFLPDGAYRSIVDMVVSRRGGVSR